MGMDAPSVLLHEFISSVHNSSSLDPVEGEIRADHDLAGCARRDRMTAAYQVPPARTGQLQPLRRSLQPSLVAAALATSTAPRLRCG
jgi:hypothetical protein